MIPSAAHDAIVAQSEPRMRSGFLRTLDKRGVREPPLHGYNCAAITVRL